MRRGWPVRRGGKQAVAPIGDPQVRNRGTIGGSHADPGADLPTLLVALGATILASGDRQIAAWQFSPASSLPACGRTSW